MKVHALKVPTLSQKPLTEKERAALEQLSRCAGDGFMRKRDLVVLASLMGAATREDYGTQKGRILRLGLAEHQIRKGWQVWYRITAEGRKALKSH
jgi:hypothetical protein